MEELINLTQLCPKMIHTSARRLHKRISLRNHHRYQPHGTKIARGEFIIKETNTKIK